MHFASSSEIPNFGGYILSAVKMKTGRVSLLSFAVSETDWVGMVLTFVDDSPRSWRNIYRNVAGVVSVPEILVNIECERFALVELAGNSRSAPGIEDLGTGRHKLGRAMKCLSCILAPHDMASHLLFGISIGLDAIDEEEFIAHICVGSSRLV
ncbi:unnamed protein product [Clonostachys solani]|uniref:Uncharacterized protein n=1 Tax=Clonostachys solani TaxID=160281 RepID=A0A9P0ENY0_9HYPO|nr:unnamed protein product [Clonostachys solani]